MTNYMELSINEIHELLKNKKIKPIDLVNEVLARIEDTKDLNCIITVNKEAAIKKAIELENMEVDNLFFGIPIIIKDNIVTKDLLTTAASHMLYNFIPTYDASVIKLINNANMIIVGKANMDEFAFGSSGETSYYGKTLNSKDKSLIPGGSSSGSASSVGAGITFISLGSDTGGSIRQPAMCNNIVGMKPTYGRVSRFGLIAFASSFDQIGPMTRTVHENAALLNVISDFDNNDLNSVETNEDFTRLLDKDISGMKILIPQYFLSASVDSKIKDRINELVTNLKNNGAIVDIKDVKYLDYSVPLYQIIALSEASSNLARFDGIRYGFSADGTDYIDKIKNTRKIGFGQEVRRRLMIGSYVLSGENAHEYYEKALQIRNEMNNEFNRVFEEYDLVIGPVSSSLPRELGSSNVNALTSFLDDMYLIPANLCGLPALSVPIKKGELISLHIMGARFNEAIVYQLGNYVEKLSEKENMYV